MSRTHARPQAAAPVCCAGLIRRLAAAAALAVSTGWGPIDETGQSETICVDLKLLSGGQLGGLVVDHTTHGLVVAKDDTPFVFAWEEIETPSAFAAKRALLALQRGGRGALNAEDHFHLGLFALSRNRNDMAAVEFRHAVRMDREYGTAAREAMEAYRRRRDSHKEDTVNQSFDDPPTAETTDGGQLGLLGRLRAAVPDRTDAGLVEAPADVQVAVLDVYRTFGATVQGVFGKSVRLVETEHFLIWTDWGENHHARLADWCESMYAALCRQFSVEASKTVFLAKCPLFCWRAKWRFDKFARQFDGYDPLDAIGYTRSIEANGHVHMVLRLPGSDEADVNRFASTLVHEGTHAFLHRMYTTRLLPHWLNEGYADLIAERVLGDRCVNGENAELLAKQFVRYGWPIRRLLSSAGPIEVHEYPLAHSVVAYLESRNPAKFAALIRGLKAGQSMEAALAAAYDSLTFEELESGWRKSIQPHASADTSALTIP